MMNASLTPQKTKMDLDQRRQSLLIPHPSGIVSRQHRLPAAEYGTTSPPGSVTAVTITRDGGDGDS